MQPVLFTVCWQPAMDRVRRTYAQVKREVDLRERERGGKEASDGMVCDSECKYRCMRCGRSSNNMKMQGTCAGPKCLAEDSKHKVGRWEKSHFGGYDMVRRVDRQGEALNSGAETARDMRDEEWSPKLMN